MSSRSNCLFNRHAAWLFLALVLPALPVRAQRVFEDEQHGYAVRPVPEWVPVPVAPHEKWMVARWASERAERGYPGRMHVLVFERDGESSGGSLESAHPRQRRTRLTPRSFQRWLRLFRPRLDLESPDRIKVRHPDGVEVTANLYEAVIPLRGGREGRDGFYYVVGVYTTPTREYALEMSCGLVNKRKYRRRFRRVVRSFRILEPPENPGAQARTAKERSPYERALRRARRDAERVPGWWYEETEHYFIVTNVERRNRDRIFDLKRRLETIRAVFERDFPPPKDIDAVSIVRVCKDRNSFRRYGGLSGAAGYWNPAAEELVLYLRGEKNFARSVLNHEAFHQYIHFAGDRARPHTWFNEGHADYYGGAEVEHGRVKIERFRWRVDEIKKHIRAESHVPLKKFLNYPKARYYADSTRCYAQGWSLVYFLREGLAPDHPWREILPRYYEVLCQARSAGKAQRIALKGVDLEDLEEAWKRYIVEERVARP